jgi:catalase
MSNPKPRSDRPKGRPPSMKVSAETVGTMLATSGGPSTAHIDAAAAEQFDHPQARRLAGKLAATHTLAASVPYNRLKAGEYGASHARRPAAGQPTIDGDPGAAGASTLSETAQSEKVGGGAPPAGVNPANQSLDRVRIDSGGQRLTTNQGVPISDNQNSLKAGLRGPALLEDFVLREKITHFDHERIPERVVHARGSAAHGYFECYHALTDLTMAAPFSTDGKRTPVFVRFSTVAGERGSSDLARDVRGFAVKFYTDQGNWDLVGNNIPVFFIQDAMKFPDLIHAVKPEPHHAMPQAASAHDTFWDFAGLMPEITHMLMWVMSDRAIPRSYRTMQGFGVHTFRLVDAKGASNFVKFHWLPVAGTHSVVWDEAVKINGADPDFHRRDLWESIEAGLYPEWELALQVFSEEQAERFTFDVLDPTKIVPEELVPLRAVGKMVLDRNPDNFFTETEQVAFCTQHVVPGIDFSNDPLLQGRNFSYLDTQISRLGGANFHEIPINSSIAQAHNNQRDGMHRQGIARGRVAYEPNSLGGGCPFQAGMAGFVSFPAADAPPTKLRGKPEKFADHFTQARLFWRSQSAVEQNHIVAAFRFELSKVQTHPVRERIVSMLRNVDDQLAQRLADGLGIALPEAQPRVLARPPAPEVESSPALSLFARPGDGSPRGRRIALLVADGCDAESLRAVYADLVAVEAVPRFVGVRLGAVKPERGEPIHAEVTLETAPAVLWDGCVLPDGERAAAALVATGQALEFVREQYRHCKPLLAIGAARMLLERAPIDPNLPDGKPDPGVVFARGGRVEKEGPSQHERGRKDDRQDPASAGLELGAAITAFRQALGQHRIYARETDPPAV